jgi:5-(carboxyamino)imidazole ribonucleotide synthase
VSAAATIGILGGGQLGRMLTLEAKRMGYRVVVLEPTTNSPTGQIADEQIVAAYDDLRFIGELGARTDLVTFEFENIPLPSIEALEADRRLVRPSGAVLRITQERLLEKQFVRECGIDTVDFSAVRAPADLPAALEQIGFPGVLKTTMGGYDGKGQWVVRSDAQAVDAIAAAKGRPLIYEQFAPFDKELSIICARNARGDVITFPVAENQHDRGVLATTIVPARISAAIAERVRRSAETIAAGLDIVGAFAIEYFLTGERLVVNEIAPRVHNTGHYSIDATTISQYEAHVRAICDLPLVAPRMLVPAVVMVNILGGGTGDELGGVNDLLRDPDVALHLYGKAHAALRRKMGHFTVLGDDPDDALSKAQHGRARLHWIDNRAMSRA